jgi:hypothetical protein
LNCQMNSSPVQNLFPSVVADDGILNSSLLDRLLIFPP